jgi:hypothetical protein
MCVCARARACVGGCRALDSAQVPKQQDQNMFSKLIKMASSLGAPRAAPPNCKAMVPMLDFINHRTAARARFSYDARADVFSVAAERAYMKGEQVFISLAFNVCTRVSSSPSLSGPTLRPTGASMCVFKGQQVRVCVSSPSPLSRPTVKAKRCVYVCLCCLCVSFSDIEGEQVFFSLFLI